MHQPLSSRISIPVRFSEVDSLRLVWHGHYLRYFEDGREDFGKRYGIGYLDVYAQGFLIPLVKADLNYKKPLEYGDTAIVETTYRDDAAAKIIFDYRILNAKDESVVCTGHTIQVFLNEAKELQLITPVFFLAWKTKMGLL
jgi:acyl-CoA thioester hydrolase